ncbi:hypothetical protein LY284_33205 [Caballeronia sp. PC1]|nr:MULTISPECIES: hypothetical protein [unclassified Caballeronia]MCE4547234.1 hypothetical protein [Caballeronia sp. PC1]MCE4575216.1 hypothetical protein [Caballeronia sp. CLC5]
MLKLFSLTAETPARKRGKFLWTLVAMTMMSLSKPIALHARYPDLYERGPSGAKAADIAPVALIAFIGYSGLEN